MEAVALEIQGQVHFQLALEHNFFNLLQQQKLSSWNTESAVVNTPDQ